MKSTIVALFFAFFIVVIANAQYRNQSYLNYIDQYKEVAMEHQRRFKIPASITLAQGLLESGAGNSVLTRQSNNHFGIKCHNDWTGERVYHDDDIKDDCFRKYNHPNESYEDHSRFLTMKPRYASLFNLDIRDYRGWATGLQTAGYATDKSYANKLIKVIEDYSLFEYDLEAMGKKDKIRTESLPRRVGPPHQVYISEKLLYVVARKGDTFESIAAELDFKVKDLVKYNEMPADYPLQEGEIIYLEKKHKKVVGNYTYHVVKPGDSMHSIAQMYGIQMKYLYKLNKLDNEYIPNDGDTLKLKK